MAGKRARTAGAVVRAAALNADVERLSSDLDALDQAIVAWNSRLNPAAIGVIHAWKGRYGKLGSLRAAIVD